MKQHQLAPRFLDEFPASLEPGILYLSMEYTSTAHLCCCGCGHEVNLTLSPRDWKMTFDGENVSLWPSVGNWSLPCQSHYIISNNRVQWAGAWSEKEIEAGRLRDRERKSHHFGEVPSTPVLTPPPVAPQPPQLSLWAKMLAWIGLRR